MIIAIVVIVTTAYIIIILFNIRRFPVFADLNNNSAYTFLTEYQCTSIIISLGQKKKKPFARQEILGSTRVHGLKSFDMLMSCF